MNEEKCFCHLNGFAVKDATARKQIEELKESLNKQNKVSGQWKLREDNIPVSIDGFFIPFMWKGASYGGFGFIMYKDNDIQYYRLTALPVGATSPLGGEPICTGKYVAVNGTLCITDITWTDSTDEGKTIIFENELTLSNEDFALLNKMAEPVESTDLKGVHIFKDTLGYDIYLDEKLNFETSNGDKFTKMYILLRGTDTLSLIYKNEETLNEVIAYEWEKVNGTFNAGSWCTTNADIENIEPYKTITILDSVEPSERFSTWFTANTIPSNKAVDKKLNELDERVKALEEGGSGSSYDDTEIKEQIEDLTQVANAGVELANTALVSVEDHETRITTLEENAGSGGGQLYEHYITLENAYNCLNFRLISYKSTEITMSDLNKYFEPLERGWVKLPGMFLTTISGELIEDQRVGVTLESSTPEPPLVFSLFYDDGRAKFILDNTTTLYDIVMPLIGE